MEKRYQVFVSSTYADLKEERQKVIQTLMEMDCIPSGMELFPATDDEQWNFIKTVIDDCDYYLLIIGGRYGSLTPQGISYTEKEYKYAVEKNIKVIALLHEEPDEIPAGKTDQDNELFQKLQKFRNEVSTGRIVKFWKTAEELPGIVALSLTKTIKTHPAIGWVRGDLNANPKLLAEINELKEKNIALEAEAKKSTPQMGAISIPNLAPIEDEFEIHGIYKKNSSRQNFPWSVTMTWENLFGLISPYLLNHISDLSAKYQLEKSLFPITGITDVFSKDLDDQIFQTIKIQFTVLNLIETEYLKTTDGNMALFWSLTEAGKKQMLISRSVKK